MTQFAGDDPDNVSPDEGAITDVAVSYDASSATISYSSAINDPSLWDGKLIFPYIPPQDAQSYALCYFPECGEYLNYAYNPLIRKGYIAHCEIGAGTAAAASVMDFTVENERLVSLARDGVTYTFRYEGDNVSEISWGSTSLALQYDGGLLQSVTVSGTGRNVFGDGTYTYSYDASGNPESCFYDDGSDMPFTYYFQTDTDGKMTGQNAPTFNLRYYNYTMEYDADPGMLSRLVCDFTSYVAAENNLVTYTMDDYVEIGSADGES